MRNVRFLTAVSIATLVFSIDANAADRATGTYIGGGFGANITQGTELNGNGTNTELDHDTGHIGVLSLGHAYANGFRGEIELGQRRNGIDESGSTKTGGSSKVLSGMINGYYDFATGTSFIPYLGAGIGVGRIEVNTDPVGTSNVRSSGTGIGVQGIAGVGYQIDDNWTGSLEYRYYTLQGADVDLGNSNSVDADYNSHSIMIGLRYTFGEKKKPVVAAAPKPAPAPKPVAQKKPAPAPAPPKPAPAPIARNYIVFFDWDKADITDEALAILKSAAENARRGNISRIQATGHADTSGTRRYNQKLSERRARAVQAQLAKLGIATNQVSVAGKGELEQLAPTPDGVREPQNRRVEIIFPQ